MKKLRRRRLSIILKKIKKLKTFVIEKMRRRHIISIHLRKKPPKCIETFIVLKQCYCMNSVIATTIENIRNKMK